MLLAKGAQATILPMRSLAIQLDPCSCGSVQPIHGGMCPTCGKSRRFDGCVSLWPFTFSLLVIIFIGMLTEVDFQNRGVLNNSNQRYCKIYIYIYDIAHDSTKISGRTLEQRCAIFSRPVPANYKLTFHFGEQKFSAKAPTNALVKALLRRCQSDTLNTFPWERGVIYTLSINIGEGEDQKEIILENDNPLWLYDLEEVNR